MDTVTNILIALLICGIIWKLWHIRKLCVVTYDKSQWSFKYDIWENASDILIYGAGLYGVVISSIWPLVIAMAVGVLTILVIGISHK